MFLLEREGQWVWVREGRENKEGGREGEREGSEGNRMGILWKLKPYILNK